MVKSLSNTSIPYATKVWHIVTGCTPCGPECANCWANRLATTRLRGHDDYKDGFHGNVKMHPERLEQPMRTRKPAVVFVAPMGDLFHAAVQGEFIANAFADMSHCEHHTFLLLSKRAKRMAQWVDRCGPNMGWITHDGTAPRLACQGTGIVVGADGRWPLPNIWLGVSISDQRTADERLPHLAKLAAAGWNTWVSYEPALGPVDMRKVPHYSRYDTLPKCIIIGGESGPNARPMHPDWVRQTRDQCAEAGVCFHFKQWGEWLPAKHSHNGLYIPQASGWQSPKWDKKPVRSWDDAQELISVKVSTSDAGHILDGKRHDALPWR